MTTRVRSSLSCHYRTARAQSYLATLLESVAEDDWLYYDVGSDNNVRLVDDVTELRHNAYATSASSSKTEFAFHMCSSFFRPKIF